MPGKYSADLASYRLAAVAIHHGQTTESGHYNCVIFDQYGQGIKFDDDTQTPVSLDRYISSRECTRNSRLLVYINTYSLIPEPLNVRPPWETQINPGDIVDVEAIWFGLAGNPT